MAQYKVLKCTFDKGNLKSQTHTNFPVNGNTESAVKQKLEKLYPSYEIVIREIKWA